MINKNVIVYIGGFKLPDKNAAAQRVISNGKILNELGYNVVYIGVNDSIENSNGILKIDSNIEGFEFYEVKYPKSKKEWFKYLISVKNIIDLLEGEYKDKIDSVIAYNYPAVALNNIRNYCKKSHIKIFSDCTEWYSANEGNFVFKVLKTIDTTIRMKVIHHKLDGIICISKYLYNYYNKSCKCVIIPPLVDLEDKKWSKKMLKKDNVIKLIYAGSPEISKGKNAKDRLDLIIEYLYEINKEYEFIFNIIGITKEQYLDSFIEHNEILDELSNKVMFMGRKTHNEVIEMVGNSDFAVFTRNNSRVTQAGFPTKFVEGISAGTPIITNESSDLKEYLINGENGFFIDIYDKNNSIKILSNILSMNKNEVNEMKDRCDKTKRFDYRNYINEFKTIIK